jgi:acyl carrier protein
MGGSDGEDEDEGADDWARMQEVGPEPEFEELCIDFEPTKLESGMESEFVRQPTAAAAAAAATIAAVIDAVVELSFASKATASALAASPASDRSSNAGGSEPEVNVPSLEEITTIVMAEVIGALQSQARESEESAESAESANADVITPAALDMGPHTNLASVGLNSQKVVGLASRLSDRFDLELPVTAALDYPTLGQLSEYVRVRLGRKLRGEGDTDEEEEEEEKEEVEAAAAERSPGAAAEVSKHSEQDAQEEDEEDEEEDEDEEEEDEDDVIMQEALVAAATAAAATAAEASATAAAAAAAATAAKADAASAAAARKAGRCKLQSLVTCIERA